jgi:D-beta-D-heptose 7-phosphate kinase/D-beta-D-heptose 1-phosphate adenosyltransferase
MLHKQAAELIEKFPSSPILVFGDVMLDSDIDCRALGVASEAPVPLLEMSQEMSRLGGAANVANNLAQLGIPTHLVGAIGIDHAAEVMKELLEDAHVCFHPLISDRLTTRKTRIHSGNHYYLRIDEEEPAALTVEQLEPGLEVVRSLLKDVRMMIVSDYDKGMVNAASAAALESLVRPPDGIKIIADLKPGNVAHWHDLDLITPNLAEARALLDLLIHEETVGRGGSELATSLGRVLNCDVVLKMSEKGLLTAARTGKVTHLEALCQVPQCVAGAGDAVLAALAAALANGATLEDSAYLANVAAAIAVSQPGPHAVSATELTQWFSAVSVG